MLKFKNKNLKKFISFAIITAIFICSLILPANANGVVSNVGVVDILSEYDPLARGTSAPTTQHNLVNNPYSLSGYFNYRAFTNYWFQPDGNGKLCYNITITYQNVTPPYHLQKNLTVEVYDKSTNKIVDTQSVDASLYPGGGGYNAHITAKKTVSSLSPTGGYYIVIQKTNDGLNADISGSIYLP